MGSTSWPDEVVPSAVCVLAVTCLALSAYTLANRRLLDERAPLSVGDRVAVLEGLTADGTPISVAPESCGLVRYSSRLCRFSREDEPGFAQLEAQARRAGCESIVVAPSKSDYFCAERSGACSHTHLSHVTLRTAEVLRLEKTPTTFLFDRGQVRWIRFGTMRDEDRVAAAAALQPLTAGLHRTRAQTDTSAAPDLAAMLVGAPR
jgi:hypothetical protein